MKNLAIFVPEETAWGTAKCTCLSMKKTESRVRTRRKKESLIRLRSRMKFSREQNYQVQLT